MSHEINRFVDEIQKLISCDNLESNISCSENEINIGRFQGLSLEKLTGLPYSFFPASGQIKPRELKSNVTSLENLLNGFGLSFAFPVNLPLDLKYGFISSVWTFENLSISTDGLIDVCNYNQEACPFPEYCQLCEEMSEQIKIDEHLRRGGFDEVDEIV